MSALSTRSLAEGSTRVEPLQHRHSHARRRTFRSAAMAIFGLSAQLALGACTTFFDTEFDAPDAATTGACCHEDACFDESAAACTRRGGSFSAGASCAESPCSAITCETYCSAHEDTCSSVEEDYPSLRGCVDFCTNGSRWPTGSPEDITGNSLACRTYHVDAASASEGPTRQFHCRHAGITGDGICGSLCENYCYLMDQICVGDNAQYANFEDCTEQCQGVGPIGGIPQDGLPNDVTGNTIQCRMYHASAAYFSGAPDMHCVHAGMLSTTPTCGALSPSPRR